MAYELRVPRSVEDQIDKYLARHADPNVRVFAAIEIGRELSKLATNPRLGTSPPGLFETRPIYQFPLKIGDGPQRIAQVVYRLVESQNAIVIGGFDIVGMISQS